MELRTYLKMLVRGWWLVLLAFGAALGVSLFLSSRTMPVYQVNARFVISPNPDLVKADNLIYSLDTLNRRSIIATFAEFLNSRSNFEAAGQLLNLPPEALANYTVTTVALPDANVLQLFIEGPDPLAAIQLAESIGRITIAQVQKNYQVYNMAVLDPPTAPSGPIHPQPVRDALLAGALGLVAGAGLALLRGILTAPQNNIDQNQIPASWSAQYFRRRTEEELDLDDAEPVSLGVNPVMRPSRQAPLPSIGLDQPPHPANRRHLAGRIAGKRCGCSLERSGICDPVPGHPQDKRSTHHAVHPTGVQPPHPG